MKIIATLLLAVTASAIQGPPPPPPPPPPPSGASAPARDLGFLPPAGGGVISGKVVTAEPTPVPLRAAIVSLRLDGFRAGWTFVTDATGTFTFTQLPAGRFTLSVSRVGFPTISYGARRPGRPGASILLKDDGSMNDLTVAVPRGSVISGRVIDDNGVPVTNQRVTSSTVIMRNGERTLGPGGSDTTDDRGEYRIYGLAAGDYVVAIDSRLGFSTAGTVRYSAQDFDAVLNGDRSRPGQVLAAIPKGQELAPSPSYYPSATSVVDASLVHVDAGEERRDVDLRTMYVPAASISGVLLDPDGKPPANVILNLTQIGAQARANFGRPSPVDGTFTFTGISPGRYAITARATPTMANGGGAMPPLWARTDVDVNGAPVTGVRVILQPGASITGNVVMESVTAAPPPATARIGLTPVLRAGEIAIGVTAAAMDKDRSFTISGVPAGRYRVDAQSSAPNSTLWMLKSATLNGQDVLDEPFDVASADLSGLTVTYTNQITSVIGSLQDATGRPAPDYYIIVFPTDQQYWHQTSRRIKTARPAMDGNFLIRGLPPGTYRIGAVTDVEPNEWFEPSFLQQLLPASAEITLREGERKMFPLKIGG